MSKPVVEVELLSIGGCTKRVRALFDTGSHYTILRDTELPEGTQILKYAKPEAFRTAATGGALHVTGTTLLKIRIGKRMVRDEVLVSPDLGREMLVGAGTMQKWDISVRNRKGRTEVTVGHDLRDPEITEVD
ncbi:MAG: hypothetical protein HYZ53_10130 [Planctomycetes bacterium]|nr:hypothetical protein [Planctomycetota bacterium]